jgi:uncharacterized membrane protein YphA (DoxX/SURF4 family)
VESTPVSPAEEATPVGRRTWAARWGEAIPWAGTAARLFLAGIFLYAGGSKITDLAASGRAVNAYDVMPVEAGRVVGAMLPMVEIALGALLLVGFATRLAAAAIALLNVVFIAGIAQAWARDLNIDCGCFGGDGSLGVGQSPRYLWEIIRDLGFLVAALLVFAVPRTRLSLDARLAGPEESE